MPASPAQKMSGYLITFEGIDGCGKSTHALRALQMIRKRGCKATLLREPGSTPTAERIRSLLLDKRMSMTAVTELLLYEASRAELTARQIMPLLASGQVVLCDRFYDSTTAYQGYGRQLDLRMVRTLHRVAVGDLVPHLTLVLDVDLPTAFARRGKELDRLESESRAFFRRVRAGFQEIARRERRRVKLIDASGPIDQVFAEVFKHILRKLSLSDGHASGTP